MKAKEIMTAFGKIVISGCIAFVVMTLFCFFYYNVPVHSPNENGSTDYRWTPDAFYCRATEGFAFGMTNNEGLLNAEDFTENSKIDILLMGSSHMEAYNVQQKNSVAGVLNDTLGDKNVYNIGVSGHNFLTCCANFESALDFYSPSDYVIIETSQLDFSAEKLQSVIDGTLPEISDHSGGILSLLSRNQFLRQAYTQLKSFVGNGNTDPDLSAESADENDVQEDTSEELSSVISNLAQTASQHDTKLIIFYHPSTGINSDGSLLLPDDHFYRNLFKEICEENGVIFLDMTERFQTEYDTDHVLPHGFSNSSVGSGHLNADGHAMIADELYKIIGD